MSLPSPATRVSNWNAANVITIVRIVMAPIVLWLLLADDGAGGSLRWAAAILFIVALATDGVDGAIARHWSLVTDLGKILDPIADKIVIAAAIIGLSILTELPWIVTAFILVREVGITVWRLVELNRGLVIPASRGGKVKTATQAVAISLALLPLSILLGPWIHVLDTVTMTVAVLLTFLTGAWYLWGSWRNNRARRHA